MKKLLVILLASVFSVTAQASQYKTRSNFDKSYKCTSDFVGGYKHDKGVSKLVAFRDEEVFFITHITDLPIEAIPPLSQVEGKDESEIRSSFENSSNVSIGGQPGVFVHEEGTYYIRVPSQNPKTSAYVLFGSKCNAGFIVGKNDESINCSDSSHIYELNLGTMRFSSSYLGSWHIKSENGETPDSSVFAFGSCEEYYP